MIDARWSVSFVVSLIGIFVVWFGLVIVDSYRFHRHPPPLGKYEEIAIFSDLYHRWYQVTPPSYAKVFLPINGY